MAHAVSCFYGPGKLRRRKHNEHHLPHGGPRLNFEKLRFMREDLNAERTGCNSFWIASSLRPTRNFGSFFAPLRQNPACDPVRF